MPKKPKPSGLIGFQNTIRIHSQSGAGAATAAMVKLAVRSQKRGPFFRFSEILNPPLPCQEDLAGVHAGGPDLIVDFKGDWAKFLHECGLADYGISQSKVDVRKDTIRYLTARARTPDARPRMVHESRELSIPPKHASDYEALKKRFTTGADLRPYLSRDIVTKRKPYNNDTLLGAWGIHHLHFKKKGTEHVLFCRITDTDAFVLQALSHKDENVWVNEEFIEIMHNNWAKEIVDEKVNLLVPEKLSRERRKSLRNENANFITTVKDGTIYLAPGGGIMTSGHSADVMMICRGIFIELEKFERDVMASSEEFRSTLNWEPEKTLRVTMMFDHQDYCIYEPSTRTRIRLNYPSSQ
jgi:hypothetical protein